MDWEVALGSCPLWQTTQLTIFPAIAFVFASETTLLSRACFTWRDTNCSAEADLQGARKPKHETDIFTRSQAKILTRSDQVLWPLALECEQVGPRNLGQSKCSCLDCGSNNNNVKCKYPGAFLWHYLLILTMAQTSCVSAAASAAGH